MINLLELGMETPTIQHLNSLVQVGLFDISDRVRYEAQQQLRNDYKGMIKRVYVNHKQILLEIYLDQQIIDAYLGDLPNHYQGHLIEIHPFSLE